MPTAQGVIPALHRPGNALRRSSANRETLQATSALAGTESGANSSLPAKDLCRERRENNEKHGQCRYVAPVGLPSIAIPDPLKQANGISERQCHGHGLKSRW